MADQRPRIEAKFDLDDLKLDPSAQIVVESRFKDFVQRFPWGTVARPASPDLPLMRDVPSDQRVFFRVKVVESTSHRLLALARRLYPVDEDDDNGGRGELFRVRCIPLGQELWRVVIDEEGAPILELNADLPDVRARFHEPEFRVAILPTAMRTVLLALCDEDVDQEDDPDSWAQRWFRFAEDLASDERPDPRESEAMRNWIDQACGAFAKRFSLISEMVAAAERRSEP
jgi:hypothetical protein